jgi:glutamate/tyrosine decarboxylase-like PLP-dependent enzyme
MLQKNRSAALDSVEIITSFWNPQWAQTETVKSSSEVNLNMMDWGSRLLGGEKSSGSLTPE